MKSRLAQEVDELIEENRRLRNGPLSIAISEARKEMERQQNQLAALVAVYSELKVKHAKLALEHGRTLKELEECKLEHEETKRILKAYRENIEIGYPSHKAMMLAKGGS